MTAGPGLLRRWAIRLARHAATVMPESRGEWAAAVSSELHAIPADYAALRWALGSVTTSYKERVRMMSVGSLRISRWMLALESLICFLPVTLLGVGVVFATEAGNKPEILALVLLSAAAIGPIGLSVAFRIVVLQRTHLSRIAVAVMCVFAAWTLLAYFGTMITVSRLEATQWWREAFLIALLPAIGAAHLAFVSRQPNGPFGTD